MPAKKIIALWLRLLLDVSEMYKAVLQFGGDGVVSVACLSVCIIVLTMYYATYYIYIYIYITTNEPTAGVIGGCRKFCVFTPPRPQQGEVFLLSQSK